MDINFFQTIFVSVSSRKKNMIDQVQEVFLQRFQQKPVIIKAPGRINLIGEHTDYNNGFVMPASIDKAMYFAMAEHENTVSYQIYSLSFDQQFNLQQSDQLPSWAKYFEAIISILKEQGKSVPGVDCAFGGDIPVGAGLSSSAALCCGFIAGLNKLFDYGFTRKEIALIAQKAEHRIGLNCGIMDQYGVLFGKDDHVFQLDCKNLNLTYHPIQFKKYCLVLMDSKIEHELEGTPYNDRRRSCERVAAKIATKYPNVQSLREVTFDTLEAFKDEIDSLDYQRAVFVLEENQRVLEVIEALHQQDFERVGELLYAGHHGLSQMYDVSLPQIDLLVSAAKNTGNVIGARMMGGGFGGCTLNLIKKDKVEETIDAIKKQYHASTGIHAQSYQVDINQGLQIL